ncbi:inosine-uridine preferring nucleoside hydrolase [Monocercomonoides exilis]|uniref:inosine-uridine preferring nucleoside hydrolase n=1 Tax=Monocercomonoides exilis TaxID=2049356 RepID=UPI0035598A48|nr:inosine-uridine preferring nucleoside hydrolase [Monocercomonoides exilis]|eukprot:MONOS_15165.1-p1 / transcript=MONOS_15165.1 / gene=MONOS_15165 / organism=Monocercomonoides_exilis_PA203 / gene_product=inosine-uridine preferring nucleoside hydrolase [EC:3.2.2.-] / transcript_product=inosine-uridine preferring nucleoside hydrolase [EC:3.2.2.-] / location=Mono_scaffold01160:14699-16402(+) / protein_length=568 / sequence_SO=supercontig / SO=protein_coding / is_pseudo=false
MKKSSIFPHLLCKYKYENCKVPYGSEEYKVSSEEKALLASLPCASVQPKPYPCYRTPCKLLIDTDIGTDIDDALALIYALRTPEIEVIGITTNYAVSTIRAAVAQKICEAHCRERGLHRGIPVVVGSSRPMGTHRNFFITHREGTPILPTDFILKNGLNEMASLEQNDAVEFMKASFERSPREITLVSIGIPTNIGLLFTKYPSVIPLIKEVVIMGCGSMSSIGTGIDWHMFEPGLNDLLIQRLISGNQIVFNPNHNVSGDTLASKILFGAKGLRIKIVPHHITAQFWLHGDSIEHLLASAFIQNEAKTVLSSAVPDQASSPEIAASITSSSTPPATSVAPVASTSSAAVSNPFAGATSLLSSTFSSGLPSNPPLAPPFSESSSSSCLVGALMQIWFNIRYPQRGQCPHDPLTIHEACFGGLPESDKEKESQMDESASPSQPSSTSSSAPSSNLSSSTSPSSPSSASPSSSSSSSSSTSTSTSTTSLTSEPWYCREDCSCVEYVRGRMVIHEWAAFSTFVPHPEGEHYLGLIVRAPQATDGCFKKGAEIDTDKTGFMKRLEKVILEL